MISFPRAYDADAPIPAVRQWTPPLENKDNKGKRKCPNRRGENHAVQ
jgi:hypothetical protein